MIIPSGVAAVDAHTLEREVQAFLRHEVPSKLQGHETRQTQAHMAMACAKVIETGGTLIVEAGTGTRKTYSILISFIFVFQIF